jgi:hypothetical protein
MRDKIMAGLQTSVMLLLVIPAGMTLGASTKVYASAGAAPRLSHPSRPQQPSTPDASMQHRGNQVMGFSQVKTVHHFLLAKRGGTIQVEARDPKDSASREQIRDHLRHIATAFANGDFTDPMEIHLQVPPGVPVMKRLKGQIQYRFEETSRGGRILIHSDNAEAVKAIHEFLRFQIREHHTGDSPGIN